MNNPNMIAQAIYGPMISIPVIYCFDKNYASPTAVSMYSAFKNSTKPLHFYCMTSETDDAVFEPIIELKNKFGMSVTFIKDIEKSFDNWKESHHISRASYLRFLMPDLMKEDKAIYIDCDTIVCGDLTQLYDIELGTNVIGGVAERRGPTASPIAKTLTDTYMNSGILLMNLKAMRDMNLLNVCVDFYTKNKEQILWHDQDMINKILENRKKELPSTWNFQLLDAPTNDLGWEAFHTASILHYNGPIKPWAPNCHPALSFIWWQYYHKTKRKK